MVKLGSPSSEYDPLNLPQHVKLFVVHDYKGPACPLKKPLKSKEPKKTLGRLYINSENAKITFETHFPAFKSLNSLVININDLKPVDVSNKGAFSDTMSLCLGNSARGHQITLLNGTLVKQAVATILNIQKKNNINSIDEKGATKAVASIITSENDALAVHNSSISEKHTPQTEFEKDTQKALLLSMKGMKGKNNIVSEDRAMGLSVETSNQNQKKITANGPPHAADAMLFDWGSNIDNSSKALKSPSIKEATHYSQPRAGAKSSVFSVMEEDSQRKSLAEISGVDSYPRYFKKSESLISPSSARRFGNDNGDRTVESSPIGIKSVADNFTPTCRLQIDPNTETINRKRKVTTQFVASSEKSSYSEQTAYEHDVSNIIEEQTTPPGRNMRCNTSKEDAALMEEWALEYLEAMSDDMLLVRNEELNIARNEDARKAAVKMTADYPEKPELIPSVQNKYSVRGLKNPGNNCYMNSVLQSVCSNPETKKCVEKSCDYMGSHVTPVFEILRELTSRLAIDPESDELCGMKPIELGRLEELKRHLATYNVSFLGDGQQDAQELFSSLMEAIDDECGGKRRKLPIILPKKYEKDDDVICLGVKKAVSEKQPEIDSMVLKSSEDIAKSNCKPNRETTGLDPSEGNAANASMEIRSHSSTPENVFLSDDDNQNVGTSSDLGVDIEANNVPSPNQRANYMDCTPPDSPIKLENETKGDIFKSDRSADKAELSEAPSVEHKIENKDIKENDAIPMVPKKCHVPQQYNLYTSFFRINEILSRECVKCKNVTSSYESNMFILACFPAEKSIQLPSLQSLFDYTFKREEIECNCSKCESKKSITWTSIKDMPTFLVVMLKRYDLNRNIGKTERLQREVVVDEFLIAGRHYNGKNESKEANFVDLVTPMLPKKNNTRSSSDRSKSKSPLKAESMCDPEDSHILMSSPASEDLFSVNSQEEQEHEQSGTLLQTGGGIRRGRSLANSKNSNGSTSDEETQTDPESPFHVTASRTSNFVVQSESRSSGNQIENPKRQRRPRNVDCIRNNNGNGDVFEAEVSDAMYFILEDNPKVPDFPERNDDVSKEVDLETRTALLHEIFDKISVTLQNPSKQYVFRVVDECWQKKMCDVYGLQVNEDITRFAGKFGAIRTFSGNTVPSGVHGIDADGNCLFRALSVWITGGDQEQHRTVRNAICELLELFPDKFEAFLEEGTDMKNYVEKMKKDTEWGTQVEIAAAATLYGVSIYTFVDGQWVSFRPLFRFTLAGEYIKNYPRETSTSHGIYLSNSSGCHYEVVMGMPAEVPTDPATSYSLISVVNHYGIYLESGHYRAHVKVPPITAEKWICCSDQVCTDTDLEEVLSSAGSNGYLYVFKRMNAL